MFERFSKAFERFFSRVATASARKPFVFLGAAVILCALALWALNSMSFSTSRTALLSKDSPEVMRFEHYMETFGAASDLIVAIEGVPRKDLEEYALELERRLEAKDDEGRPLYPEIADADARMDLEFFVSHGFTMLPREQFDQAASFMNGLLNLNGKLPQDIDGALKLGEDYFANPPSIPTSDIDMNAAKNALNGMQFFLDEWLRWLNADQTPEEIDWGTLLADQPEAQKMVTGGGFYDSHDGSMLFVFVRKASGSEEFTFIKPFYENIRKVNDGLKAEWAAAGRAIPTTGLAGMPSTLYEEYSYIQEGVKWTIVGAAILICLIIIFVMKSFRRGIVVFAAMGIGSIWSFGLIWAGVGHMTMVTTAFTAVLFGLGVDYGVFISSRIIEEMKRGVPMMDAISIGTGASAKPVITSGLASMLVFGSLATVKFTGFSELGMVAMFGVFAVQLSTFTMLPALFALLKPRPAEALGQNTAEVKPESKGSRFPRPVATALILVAVAVAALGAFKGVNLPFDYDVLNMLPKDSETAIYSKRMVTESDYQSEVVIMIAKDFDEARSIEVRLNEHIKRWKDKENEGKASISRADELTAQARQLDNDARAEGLTEIARTELTTKAAASREEATALRVSGEKALTEADGLKRIVKFQSPMQFFPNDAEDRVVPAQAVGRNLIGAVGSDDSDDSDVARFINDSEHFKLPENGAPLRIAGILENAAQMIDDYNEAAFSAGHGELSASLDRIATTLGKIIETLKTNSDKAGPANQAFLSSMADDARYMIRNLGKWNNAKVMKPGDLPSNLQSRFFGKDGTIAIYVYPAKSVYDIDFLKGMMAEVYEINPAATGFPTTHNVQAELARSSFFQGTAIALVVSMLFLFLMLRSVPRFLVAALPLLVGEGLMLGILWILSEFAGYRYNYANIIALPLLMALALDYGIWFAHRYDEMTQLSPWQIVRVAGIPILVAAVTTMAGIGALSVAKYRGISTLGLAVIIGLVCCLGCALILSPAVAQLFGRRKTV
ncbi:MAG TPA: MMPL family transporter [Myxococcota bacterium]|nr:MMPL family transporter [Myxococcota bacterium]HQP95627.1 MMPL family transporter [Myxococcota bacterium]